MKNRNKLLSIFPGLVKPSAPPSVAEYLKSTGLTTPESWDKFAFECAIPRYNLRKIMQGEVTNISDELLLQMSFHSGMDFTKLKNINDAWKAYKHKGYRY